MKLWKEITTLVHLLAMLDYVVSLQTFLTKTRIRELKGSPLQCSDSLLDQSTEEFTKLNESVCLALTKAASHHSLPVTLTKCKIHIVTCDQNLPLVSTRVDIRSGSNDMTAQQVHGLFSIQTLTKDAVISVDYLQVMDFNECSAGEHDCHSNALCKNTIGSYSCFCKKGYIDSPTVQAGRSCGVKCGEHACRNDGECVLVNGWPSCKCTDEYAGPTCEVLRKDLEWLWILAATVVVFTVVTIPAGACLCVYIKTKRKTRSPCEFTTFS